MPTTLEKEHQLQNEITPRVEHELPGVDVLSRFDSVELDFARGEVRFRLPA